ncbi:MAG: hypothetical protein JXA67_14270, partial [Micromonosporaceae bacterium]|nr:hypothetical protein [Micromonosporaceae bacterium]
WQGRHQCRLRRSDVSGSPHAPHAGSPFGRVAAAPAGRTTSRIGPTATITNILWHARIVLTNPSLAAAPSTLAAPEDSALLARCR